MIFLILILFALALGLTYGFRKLIGERRWGKLMHFRRKTV